VAEVLLFGRIERFSFPPLPDPTKLASLSASLSSSFPSIHREEAWETLM